MFLNNLGSGEDPVITWLKKGECNMDKVKKDKKNVYLQTIGITV